MSVAVDVGEHCRRHQAHLAQHIAIRSVRHKPSSLVMQQYRRCCLRVTAWNRASADEEVEVTVSIIVTERQRPARRVLRLYERLRTGADAPSARYRHTHHRRYVLPLPRRDAKEQACTRGRREAEDCGEIRKGHWPLSSLPCQSTVIVSEDPHTSATPAADE